ncbi:MAG: META domain-containing protein, partial [Muribaculaceae bacterium]|nr:META domain-containing protein [Muribaculaceae bacterium]
MKTTIVTIAAMLLLTATSCDILKSATTKSKNVATTETNKTPTPEKIEFIPGEWSVFTIDDHQLQGDERPYITFDSATSRFYGSNGCNTLNGDYAVNGNQLTLSNVISTQRYCPDAEYELQINNAINNVRTFRITNIGNESYMTFMSGSGKTLMVIRKHNMD